MTLAPPPSSRVQLTEDGKLRHFLSVEHLPRSLLEDILDTAASFVDVGGRAIKKVPLLRGKTVVNLFFESSTRTRSTFELAAKRLSADVLNLDIAKSATSKGETLLDTLRNLEAMAADMFVVRHQDSGAPFFIANEVTPRVAVINAGDGRHAHPTQAMLDMYTIRHYKGGFAGLRVAIVGDILHSRVARSQIHALNILGAEEVRLIGPRTLLPTDVEQLGVSVFTDMAQGLKDVDVVIMLRLQKERMDSALLPSEGEFFRLYGLNNEKLRHARPDAIVMHPGPINRGVEIASEVADGPRSVILNQVTFGIAVRMAVMSMTISGQESSYNVDREATMAARAHLLIRKGRVIDPLSDRDEVADLLVEDGRLVRIGASLDAPGAEIIDAEGHWVIPGLVDACVHLSLPGSGRAGDIASETRAAAGGGITHMAAQPDCGPVDSTAVVRLIREQAGQAGFARVLPVAALTQGLEGNQLAEMATLARAGCIAVGQAGARVVDALVLKRGLEYAATFDLPVMFRPQDAALAGGGCAHDGPVATRLGLPGIPAVAESVDLARDLLLVEATGVRAHFQQISSRESLWLLREAKRRGLPVTADVSIHHLLLDESAIEGFNSYCHVIPPLRGAADREALLAAVADGTIDAICSQHQPVGSSSKAAPFPASKPGISGLDSLLPLILKLVAEGALPLHRALDAVTAAPARCLGIQAGQLEAGRPASLCVLAADENRGLASHWLSAGRNSPWRNATLPGAVKLTVCQGKVSWLSD